MKALIRAILLLILLAAGWKAWMHHKYSVRILMPDGSPASGARVTIFVSGGSSPVDLKGAGWPERAERDGVYRIPRRPKSDLHVIASMEREGIPYYGQWRSEGDDSWPMRIDLALR